MSNISERIAALSLEQRKLLELRLKQKQTLFISPATASATVPLSSMQQGLWLANQLYPDLPLYNESSLFKLTGIVKIESIAKSINKIVARHDILRTIFEVDGEKVTQVIKPHLDISLTIIDNIESNPTEIQNSINYYAGLPFDLKQLPLLRCIVFKLSQQEHLLLITMHHLISDGWSWVIFCQELAAFYQGLSLPNLKIQYSNFSLWQQENLLNKITPQLNYWQKKLKAAPTILKLATDYPRRVTPSFKGKRETFIISKSLTKKLKALAKEAQVTTFMLLLAAFKTLLYRYTQQTDIIVGTPIANRDRLEFEGLIGCFINTLVLRSDLGSDPSFSQLLQQIKTTTIGAYQHQDLPLEELLKALKIVRSQGINPLFQVMFVYQPAPLLNFALPDLTITSLPLDNGIAKFDLTLYIEDTQELLGFLEYSSDLFTEDTITRMLANFQTLLTAIVSDPDAHISSLPLLTPAEKNKLLFEWNNTQASYPLDICLHQLFEQQVTKTPDAVAVIFETQITYTQLNQQANKLAHYLQYLGVEKDVLVGICLERSLYMVVGLLAILKAGGAYVPIDPSYPKKRRDLIILDAGLEIILTQQDLRSSLSNHTAQLICLDTEWDKDYSFSTQDSPISNSTPDSLAYVIYTSGSTGTPKGAMNTHRGICNRLLWMQETYQLTVDDAVLQKTPFSFDVSVWEFFWTLITGARLVIAVPGGHLDVRYLVKTISYHNITIIHFVPSMLQVFLEDPEIATLTSLRQVICSGEALPVSLQTKFFTQLSAKLDNLYGPTEAAIDVTYWQCQPDSNLTTVPIGRPIANTQIYILDKHLQPLPIGVTGELYIAGVGVARGYLNRPQLSCEKFIQVPGNRFLSPLYKTGDLARYLTDGNIEYRGRIDNQIKLRGFRIELGEIEAVLSNYPGVREAVVIVKELSQSLIAYLVLDHHKTTIEKIRCQLKQQLPEYMIPNAFVVLEALPLTSSGKVNRLALGKIDLEVDSYLAPSTPVEEILTGIWSVILNVEGVGIEDNFFELGGHSLLATQVISQVRQIWGVEIGLKEIFSAPTIAQFSLLIENAIKSRNSWQDLPIKATNRDKNIPLSFAQQRLWFLQQLEPDSNAYNGSNLILMTGLLNVEALEKSINEIARRHEVLRTSFIFRDNQAVQEIAEELPIPLEIIDLENLSKIEQQTAVKRVIAASSNQPFKLTQAPLFRVSLIKLKSAKQLLLLTIHHIISDAWSAGIFIKEISTLYAAFSTAKQSPLPELPIQYADFALWQREWLQGEFLDRQLSYWKQQLQTANSNLKLPVDISSQQVSAIGKQYHFSLPSELSQQLTSFSQQQGVTLFMTLLTIYNTLLYSYNQQEDISIGSPIANRNRSEIESLIGFFVNTLVLRTNLANNPTFTQLLQRVRNTALDAYAHQDVPFEKIVAALKPVRDKSNPSPLFQVWFVLQNVPTPTLKLAGLDLSLIDVETGIVRHDLKLDLTKTESGIQGFFEYKQNLFAEEVIAHLAQRFITISSLIVRDSEIKLKELLECLI